MVKYVHTHMAEFRCVNMSNKLLLIGILGFMLIAPVSASTIMVAPFSMVVTEVDDITGNKIWEYYGFGMEPNKYDPKYPAVAQRLDNGNTLIVATGSNIVYELRSSDYDPEELFNGFTMDSVVWDYDSNQPIYAKRLDNGNTLIAERGNNRAIEVDANKNIVWQTPSDMGIVDITTVDKLNDKRLITDQGNLGTVVLNESNDTVWECIGGINAIFTPEGNILIAYPDGWIREYTMGEELVSNIGHDDPLWSEIQSILDKQSVSYVTENLDMYLETLDSTNKEYYDFMVYLFKWYAENDETYYFNQTALEMNFENDTITVHIAQTYRSMLMSNETVTDQLKITFKKIGGEWKDSGTVVFYLSQNSCTLENQVWEYLDAFEDFGYPVSLQRIEKGRTIVSDYTNNRAFEVDKYWNIMWGYGTGLCDPVGKYICHPVYAMRTPGSKNIASNKIVFQYEVSDSSEIESCSLYTDVTGVWEKFDTKTKIAQGLNEFVIPSLYASTYEWNVECSDVNGNSAFLEDVNWSFTINEE